MKLPLTTTILGDEITITEGKLNGKLGQWDEATSTITLDSDLPAYGKIVILIHEIMHVIESMLLDNKIIQERIDHEYINGGAFGICALLTSAGVISGMTEKDVHDFIEQQQNLNNA